MSARSNVIPCIRYRDAAAMIEWLCDVVGFENQLIVPTAGNLVAHAQLTLGNGMVMIGSVLEAKTESGNATTPITESQGQPTQSPYVIVSDADAVYERARAAGAEIVHELKDEEYGGRGFSFRDPEGYIWNIGTYDPWK